MARKIPEETREKQRLAAQVRWLRMNEKEAKELKKDIAQGMRSYWSRKTKEERSEIAKKAAASRKANRIAKAKAKESAE